MKRIGLMLGFFAVTIFVLPTWTAQEVKKDEKKDLEKKDDEKKIDKKIVPEKPVYSVKFTTKITAISANSSREFTIERYEKDQKKIADVQTWYSTRLAQLNKQQYDASIQKDFKARVNAFATYQKDLYNFQVEYGKKSTNIYSAKAMEVRATEGAKVRVMFPPVEFDDQGFLKKWTKKEIEERKDKTGLPGFGVEFDALKIGQTVEIYMAKPAAPMPKKKKGPDDDDPGAGKDRQEFVLIVILQESK